MRGNPLLKLLDRWVGRLLTLLWIPLARRRPWNAAADPSPSTILVIRLAAMGDTVLLIPVIQALRERFPEATLLFAGTRINEPVIGLFPSLVDRFVHVDVGRLVLRPWTALRLIRGLRRQRIDLVLDFEQWSYLSTLLARAVAFGGCVGFRTPDPIRHRLYDVTVARDPTVHEARNFVALARAAGVDGDVPEPALPVGPEEISRARSVLSAAGRQPEDRLVVVHPGCGAHGFPREWPVERYDAVCHALAKGGGTFFVFTGAGAEVRLAKRLHDTLPDASLVWTEPGLPSLLALLSLSDLLISGNNGVMHLAAALHVPQVALHGPTSAAKWGPLNPKAVVINSSCPECPCLDLGFEYHRTDGYCMAQIGVEEVLAAAQELLGT